MAQGLGLLQPGYDLTRNNERIETMNIIQRYKQGQRAILALQEIKRMADALEQEIEDPTGDGMGTDARPPTGNDYNDLLSAVQHGLKVIEGR